MGMTAMGPGMGLLVMSPIMQSLFDVIGWRKSLMVIAAMLCVPGVLAIYVFDPNVTDESSVAKETETNVEERCNTGARRLLDFSACRNSHFLIYTAAVFVAFVGHWVPSVHMVRKF